LLNLFFNGTTALINLGLAGILLAASAFVTQKKIGILNWVQLPLWAEIILGILLLDLIGAYLIHFVEHKVKWMWKFHLIHHSDTNIDVTSGLRHNPGESLFRYFFTLLAIIVVGAPIYIFFMYQSLSALFAHLTHANLRIPDKVDYALSWVLVTPNMHKVHHHFEQPLTDTNYGNIFSIWDRFFGTYAYVEDTATLTYGVDTHMDPKENDNLWNLLAIPFQKYRPTPKKMPETEVSKNKEVLSLKG
jgi:sterol desaturase/sphingolipid hydroxylase (fatty acid hydroxylase superfamily)